MQDRDSEGQVLRIGLLGAGRIGNVHAKTISSHPHSQLCAVSNVFAENAEKLADAYGASIRGLMTFWPIPRSTRC